MAINVSSTNLPTRVKLVKTLVANLLQDGSNTRILLTGDPGIGKTSFVQQFCHLAGLELVLIEVPHIIEEHMVNVPFIVFNGAGQQTASSSLQFDKNRYEVLARSNLVSRLHAARQLTTPELLNRIYSSNDKTISQLHEQLGGTTEKLSKLIEAVRQKYSCLLFLDEFFRKTSTPIRNMLRGILNGNIGLDKMPPHCAAVYASNMNDTGLDQQLEHEDFVFKKMTPPSKDEWFTYLVNKFKEDQDVQLNMTIIEKFSKILEDQDMSHNHTGLMSSVRTSPRRWEQVLLYINAALPCDGAGEAADLLANVKAMFTHYESKESSSLWPKVEKALRELIKETSAVEVGKPTESSAWRSTLMHQIKMKEKLGEHRKYVPVISGPPGIGKSAEAFEIAEDLKLLYVFIDTSTLNPDDVTGQPIPDGGDKGKDLGVDFAKPKLFITIENKIKAAEEAWRSNPNYDPSWEKERWKYLIFFDELNRTKSVNVFNSVRKLLLDKHFTEDTVNDDGSVNEGLKLPEGSIVIAAINPVGKGTMKMTSHMLDVLDVIDSHPNWTAFKKFIDTEIKGPARQKAVIWNIVDQFTERFEVPHNDSVPQESRRFYLAATDGDPLYLSPREMTQIFSNMQKRLEFLVDDHLTDKNGKIDAQKLDDDEFAQHVIQMADDEIYEAFEGTIESAFNKRKLDADTFLEGVRDWVGTVNPIMALITDTKSTAKFSAIVDPYFENPSKSLTSDSELSAYFNSGVSNVEYGKDLLNFLQSKFKEIQNIVKYVFEKSATKKERNGYDIEDLDEEVSLLEHFMRDLIHALHINEIDNNYIETTSETDTMFLQNLTELILSSAAYLNHEGKDETEFEVELINKAEETVESISKFLASQKSETV
jgi:hypothetical protein